MTESEDPTEGQSGAARAASETAPDASSEVAAGDGERQGLGIVVEAGLPRIRAGNDDFNVVARGTFSEKDAEGYLPSPESDLLRVRIDRFDDSRKRSPHKEAEAKKGHRELFEGPLDLLLFLIEKHALDILDIPLKVIVLEYLKVLDEMRELNLDVAGEFLVMAAQLAQMKSKMLLPKEERPKDDTPELDPRADLVRRLLEYQRFKDAAQRLDELPQLGRDVYARPLVPAQYDAVVEAPKEEGLNLAEVDPLELIRLFDGILKRQQKIVVHEVLVERISVGARINEMVDIFTGDRSREVYSFAELVDRFGPRTRRGVIVCFLSMLEMARLRLIHLRQDAETLAISIAPRHDNLRGDDDDVILSQKLATVDEFGGESETEEAAS